MKLLFIHLSDIHIKSERIQNPVLERSEQIFMAIKSSISSADTCFILVTGDIAFSGSPLEYSLATDFFQTLCSKISSWYGKPPIFITVPGNHDCDFAKVGSVRTLLLDHLKMSNIDDEQISVCTSIQDSYFNFESSWPPTDRTVPINNKLLSVHLFNINSMIVAFHLLNSAWMSRLHENQGHLYYPSQFIDGIKHQPPSPSLVITMLHHPYNWFESNNSRALRSSIESTSDIVLTGHEHDGLTYTRSYHPGEHIEYIEAGVLQDSHNPTSSFFNTIIVDTDNNTYDHFCYDFDVNDNIYIPRQLDTKSFLRNKKRLRSDFEINDGFAMALCDPGAKFTHPFKDRIVSDDLFVYPNLRELQISVQRKKSDGVIRSSDVFSSVLKHRKVLIIGSDKAGKSALAHRLFSDFHASGKIPVLIQGEVFVSSDEVKTANIIRQAFTNQYSDNLLERFLQSDRPQKVVIVDNYHRILLNRKGKEKVLGTLSINFDTVILTGSDTVCLEELISSSDDMRLLMEFKHYEIMEFGHLLRNELIKKWYCLGRQFTEDESEQQTKIIQAENIISTLLGRNFMPSYPIFILILLQQLETKTPVETTSGAYGYLYEVLITTSLSGVSSKGSDIDTKYNYLTEFAFHLFNEKQKYLNNEEMRNWHKNIASAIK